MTRTVGPDWRTVRDLGRHGLARGGRGPGLARAAGPQGWRVGPLSALVGQARSAPPASLACPGPAEARLATAVAATGRRPGRGPRDWHGPLSEAVLARRATGPGLLASLAQSLNECQARLGRPPPGRALPVARGHWQGQGPLFPDF